MLSSHTGTSNRCRLIAFLVFARTSLGEPRPSLGAWVHVVSPEHSIPAFPGSLLGLFVAAPSPFSGSTDVLASDGMVSILKFLLMGLFAAISDICVQMFCTKVETLWSQMQQEHG
jgi:hypothetical protein